MEEKKTRKTLGNRVTLCTYILNNKNSRKNFILIKKQFKQAGITLVALVVTIIVLLILAGVTINLALGNNGILDKARVIRAINSYNTAEERVQMAYMSVETEIARQLAQNPNYNAGTSENTTKLGRLVSQDLTEDNMEFKVDANSAGGILITYENKDLQLEETNDEKIVQTGKVEYKIILQRQNAILKTNTGYSEEIETNLVVDTKTKTTPWVKFADSEQTYRVLYDVSSPYGIEIITSNAIGNVTLGKNDPAGNGIEEAGNMGSSQRAIWSYHNTIDTLNKTAENSVDVNTNMVDSIRSVGSLPYYKDYRNREKFNDTLGLKCNDLLIETIKIYEQSETINDFVTGKTVRKESNSTLDYNQMIQLNIINTNKFYYLATRYVDVGKASATFHFSAVGENGKGAWGRFFSKDEGNGRFVLYSYNGAIRPVLHLTPNIKITSGDGLSEETAYVIEEK